jgi:hypothetical protein
MPALELPLDDLAITCMPGGLSLRQGIAAKFAPP